MRRIFLVVLLLLPLTLARAADLSITEVQITGGEGKTKNDYVKIYNNTDNVLDLAGYRLVKRTKTGSADTSLKSWTDSTPLNPRGFYLWANSEDDFATSINADCSTTATLAENNSIAIRQGASDSGTIIDAVSWGETSDNSLGLNNHFDNPANGKIIINQNNQNNELPPASTNTGNQTTVSGVSYCQATSGSVVINEFVPNPNEEETEWLELYNNCSLPVQLNDWIIADGAGNETKLSGLLEKFFVIESPKGNLNNSGDLIILKNASGSLIDQILYGSFDEQTGAPAPAKGQSLGRIKDGFDTDSFSDFAVSQNPTKNEANDFSQNSQTTNDDQLIADTQSASDLIINELLPNPLAADDQEGPCGYEFIELYNQSDKIIDLKNWRLSVNEQKSYIFNEGEIKPKKYFVLKRSQSKLNLNNDKATVKLYAPDSLKAQQSVSYSQALEGLSYSYASSTKSWSWSLSKTPNYTNIITKPNEAPKAIISSPSTVEPGQILFLDGSDSFDPEGKALSWHWEFADGSVSDQSSLEKIFNQAGDSSVVLTVSDGELSNSQTLKLKIGQTKTPSQPKTEEVELTVAKQTTTENKIEVKPGIFKLRAIVLVEAGIFGSQFFYVAPLNDADQAEDTAIQVYNYKKDFPALKQGDLIEITGEIYDISTDTRLKIENAQAITVLDHDYATIEKNLAIKELKATLNNQLITISGRLTEKKTNGFFLDDGSGEIFIELKPNTGLSAKNFSDNKNYQIIGLLKATDNSLKLWPRSAKDIFEPENQGEVLGEKIVADEKNDEPIITKNTSQDQQKFWQYLAIASWGTTLALIIFLIKNHFSKNKKE